MNRVLLLSLAVLVAQAVQADNHAQPTVYGQYYAIVVSEPEAAAEAMTRYRESATGRKLKSTVTLSAVVANGTDQATHTVSVFYPSAAAMEADNQASMGTDDRAAFARAMNNVASIEAENVFTQTHSRVNEEGQGGPGAATMLFGMTVLDAERYGKALETIIESDAAAAFPGNMNAGAVVAMGDDPGTHWVAFQAKDMATLLTGVQTFMNSRDFANYAKEAPGFRRIEGRYISRTVLVLGPQ